MDSMHSLLRRQLLKTFGSLENVPDELKSFLSGISAAYTQFDHDRSMLERSLDLSSDELLQLNADLRAIFDVLPDLFFRLDNDGRILDCKSGAGTELFTSHRSLIGKYIQDIPVLEVGRKFGEALATVRVTKSMVSLEYSLNSDNREAYYEARILPMANTQLVTVVRDITERKNAEIALREGEARLRLIVENAFDAIVGMDASGKIIVWNPQAERTFGWTESEAIGKNFAETILQERERQKYSAQMKDFQLDGTFPILGKSVEIQALHKDGRELSVELAISPIRLNNVVFFSAFLRDISERKQLQLERELMEVQLLHSQKLEAIGNLAAGIAHEINTPAQYIGDNTRFVSETFRDLERVLESQDKLLAAANEELFAPDLVAEILKATKAADMEFLRAEIPKAIDQALEGVERVTTIVRAMKDFSHPGTTEKVATDLNRAIQSTITVCRSEWKYVAEMDIDLEPDLPATLCLPSELNQVFLNIIVNAAHAIGEATDDGANGRGRISIQTRSEGDRNVIRISDTGAGIPEEARGRIFDPFFTTKGVGKGTGQGLAIARSVVVDKHGGTIDFETETGKGTTFVIRLPIHKVEAYVES